LGVDSARCYKERIDGLEIQSVEVGSFDGVERKLEVRPETVCHQKVRMMLIESVLACLRADNLLEKNGHGVRGITLGVRLRNIAINVRASQVQPQSVVLV
jgi:hypothetical protein